MNIDLLKIVTLALAIRLCAACDTEHHQLGGTEEGLDASDAANEPDDGDGSSCSCSSGPLFAGSALIAGRSSLACYCRDRRCPSYDDSLSTEFCGQVPQIAVSTYSDCDLIQIENGGGYTSSSFTYDATTHELVGAYTASDIPTFPCGDSTVYALVAGVRPFPGCTLRERVNLCE